MIENARVATRFRREVGSTLAAQVTALIVNAITLVLVARWLGTSGKGVQALITTTAQLVASLGSFGLAGSVPYFVAASRDRTTAALRNGAWMLGVVLLLGVIVAVGERSIGGLGFEGHEAVLLALVVTTSALTYASALLLALGDVRWFNRLVVADAAIAFVGSVIAEQIAAGDPDAFVLAQAVAMGMASLAALGRIRSLTSAMPERALPLRQQLRVALLGYASGAFVQLATRADLLIVTAIGGGLSAAGVYSVAVAVSETILRVPQWVAQLLTPRVARAAVTPRTTVTLALAAMTSAAIASVFVVALSGPLEALLATAIGPGFVPAYAVVIVLLPRIVFQSGTTMLAGDLAGRGYTLYHPVATGAGVLVVVIVDLALVPLLGPVGAGLGASTGAFVTLIIFGIGFRRADKRRVETAPVPAESPFS